MSKNYDKIQNSISTLIDKLDANVELNNYGLTGGGKNDTYSAAPVYTNNTIQQLADVIERLDRVAGSIYYREKYVQDTVGNAQGGSNNA